MSIRLLMSLVIVATLGCACSWSPEAKVKRAVRHELPWVDEKLIGETHEIAEWSTIFGPAFAVELKTRAPFGEAMYCLTERAPSHRLLLFYDCHRFSTADRNPPTGEAADQQLRTKVEEFNQALGTGVQLGALNKYIYASILSRCLFDETINPESVVQSELTEPRISFDPEDGGYVFRLFHSHDEVRKELRYWVVDTKDGGFIQSWKIVEEYEKEPKQGIRSVSGTDQK